MGGTCGPACDRLHTNVHNNASRATTERLAEANQRVQKEETSLDGREVGSARTQHNGKKGSDENYAK